MIKMTFTHVHSLNRDSCGYRDNLTDISVHHATEHKKVRIKCQDLVQKIALFKNNTLAGSMIRLASGNKL